MRKNIFGDLDFIVDIDDFVVRGGRPDIPEGSPEEFAQVIRSSWVCIGNKHRLANCLRRTSQMLAQAGLIFWGL